MASSDLPRRPESVTTDPGFDLTGRRALVTGASTGIGAAITVRLAQAGARVVAASRSGRRPEPAGDPTTESRIIPVAADLEVESDLDGLVALAVGHLGGLDIMVNNAGRGDFKPLVEMDRTWFDGLVGLNLWAPLRLCQLAHPDLARSDDAVVVMVGSVDASRPSAGAGVYGATKAGLAAASVALSKEWAGDGIRVVQVDPGLIRTSMAADAVDRVESAEATINAVGRVGRPEEVAGLVHYLVSPLGRFTTGAAFRVDGGALAMGPFDVQPER